MATLRATTDGLVTIRPPANGDARVLITGRDDEFHRWLGQGDAAPDPVACIVVGGEVVGWVDYDVDRVWLDPGEVNIGYNVFASHRGNGYATRAVQLLMHHLATNGDHRVATLLIHPENRRSLALAERARFDRFDDLDGNPYFKRPVPALSYSDGTVTIRRQRIDDIDADLEAKDTEQITWLWLPGQRSAWEAMSVDEQRNHALRDLHASIDAFGGGPKWAFSVDTADAACVAYVDCNLGNDRVPRGEANIAYATHPAHRGRGYVIRAVRLVTQFLADHTGAREVHIIAAEGNVASIRIAHAVGAVATAQLIDEQGRTLIRHVLVI